MSTTEKQHKETIERLDSIETLLQNLIILEGASAGLTRDEVRDIAGVATARVSKLWKNVKPKQEK